MFHGPLARTSRLIGWEALHQANLFERASSLTDVDVAQSR